MSIPLIVLADSWSYYVEFTVSDNSSTDRTNLPVIVPIRTQNSINAGYLDSSGNQTNVREGSYDRNYGVSGNVTLFIPSLLANQSRTYRFYTNFVTAVTHKIITGVGGYITIGDSANLEWGNSGNVSLSGFIDTTAGANKYIFNHYDVVNGGVQLFVSPTVSGNITASIWSYLPVWDFPYSDNFSADTWTDITAMISVNTANSHLEYESPRIAADHRTYKAIPTMSDTSWKTQIEIHPTSSNGTSSFYFGAIATPENIITATSDMIMCKVHAGYMDIFCRDGAVTYQTTNNITFSYGNTYYAVLERTSAIETRLSVYSDVGLTTHITGSPCTLAIPNTIVGLDNLQGSNLNNAVGGTPTEIGWIDNFNLRNEEISVSATGIDSDEYTVAATANTTSWGIYIDGVLEDTVALGGVTIPDSTSDWVILSANTTPYADYYRHSVGGALVTRYQPNEMISGTTLPDREVAGNDATITWGSNPNGIEVDIGSITSYEATTADVETVTTISHKFEEAAEPAGWWVTGTFGGTLTPELKESFADAATDMGMPEQSLWLIIWFGVSIAIGLSVLLFTGNILISLVIVIAGLWAGVNANVIDFGLVFLVIVLGFGGLYLARQH